MVISYLEKLQKNYIEERQKVNEEYEKLQLSLRENNELIKLLEKTSDPNYESFTPRDVNTKQKFKILELQNENEQIEQEMNRVKKIYEEYTAKLEELYEVIIVAKEKMKD